MAGDCGKFIWSGLFALLVALLFSAATAKAALLPPGATVVPDPIPFPTGTIIDDLTTPFIGTDFTSSIVFTGTIRSRVIQTGSGMLDFVYTISSDSSSLEAIDTLSLSSYAGFGADADYVTPATGIIPTDARRSATPGTTVFFDFLDAGDGGNGEISNGDVSADLVVETNSAFFTLGGAAVIDGGTGTSFADVPFGVPVAPEPASLATIIAVAGLTSFNRKRRN